MLASALDKVSIAADDGTVFDIFNSPAEPACVDAVNATLAPWIWIYLVRALIAIASEACSRHWLGVAA